MLTKKTNGVANGPRLSKALAGVVGSAVDRRTFLKRSGLAVGGVAAASTLSSGMVKKAAAQSAGGSEVQQIKSVCTHCSVGCTVIAEVDKGVWVGQEPGWDSPFNLGAHCAKGAAVREHAHGERRLKHPVKMVDGKWQKDQLGPGDQRDRRQDARDPRELRARLGLLARLGQAQQRAGLSVPQVLCLLGLEQRRPSGADLSLDHGRGCGEHLGLRRDDQQLQRHPQLARHLRDRRQSRRGAPGRPAAHAEGQGAEQRALHRVRPALHPDRGPRGRVRPLPAGHRRGADLGHPLACLRERLGGQGVHPPARLGHGPDQGRGRQVEPGGDRAGHRRSGLAAQAGRAHAGQQPPLHHHLVHGRHPAHQRQQQHARLLRVGLGARHDRHPGWRRQHLPRPRQRAGRDRSRRPVPHAAGLLRHQDWLLEALGPGLGRRLRLPARPFRQQGADGVQGHPGVALVRPGARSQGEHRPARQPPGHGVRRSRAELPDPAAGHEEGDGEARPPGRDRSLSDHDGGHAGPAERHLPAAGGDPVRDLWLGHRVEPLDPVARQGLRSAVRVQAGPRDPVSLGPEARLCRRDVQEHPDQRHRALGRGHHRRDQSRHVDDRLHRPVAGAPARPHGQPAHLRPHHASGGRRAGRRRVLRHAVALLGQSGDGSSGHACALRSLQAGRRGRALLPGALRCRAGRPEPPGRGAATRSIRRSRTAIPSSPWPCSRSSAGTAI